jgi:hypothetical protein
MCTVEGREAYTHVVRMPLRVSFSASIPFATVFASAGSTARHLRQLTCHLDVRTYLCERCTGFGGRGRKELTKEKNSRV